MTMFLTWTTTLSVLIALLFFLLQAFRSKRNAKTKPLPPGPRGFPIFGSLHLLGKYPHKDLQKLAEQYGSIMHLRLGLIPTIVISSPQAAELFLKTHDVVFASRPSIEALKHMNYEQKDLIFAPYGSYWRTLRKMCTSGLLSNHKINSFKSMRKEELCLLIDYIKDNQEAGVVAVDLSDKVTSLIVDMTCRMVFGKKYGEKEYFDERGFKAVIQEGMKLVGTPNLGDYIPQIASLDLHRVTKKMKAIAKAYDVFFEKIIDEHVRSTEENRNKDFVDVMLGFMGAEATEYPASDPTSTTIEWALSELIKRPRIMKKVQKELESVVGLDRMVEESDLDNLEYLDMVIKENFRFRPVSPLLIPHESVQDCTVNGFHIPNKSRIMINVWAIGRDASIWNDPDEFLPERFIGSNIEPRGRDFELLPFGSGRRACAGMQLGLTVVRLVLAQLVHCFDWELPDGMLPTELDMTEEFGQVIFRAKHLMALPTYRLNK
ncbi:hypothetical protein Dsin_007036 [Dipteronia sinensis]|uniref:Cytochrome P450 n=1 Tax=Dipteronia sinensis TaxID=43782 RepID=A0AAE0B0V8_9ROSI|nr:hypothetical protein Dsin_007036 [Dipteronia sinensis]